MIIGYLHYDAKHDESYFTLGKRLQEFDDITIVKMLDDIIEELQTERDFRVYIQGTSSNPQLSDHQPARHDDSSIKKS